MIRTHLNQNFPRAVKRNYKIIVVTAAIFIISSGVAFTANQMGENPVNSAIEGQAEPSLERMRDMTRDLLFTVEENGLFAADGAVQGGELRSAPRGIERSCRGSVAHGAKWAGVRCCRRTLWLQPAHDTPSASLWLAVAPPTGAVANCRFDHPSARLLMESVLAQLDLSCSSVSAAALIEGRQRQLYQPGCLS